jgi:catechol 2,3-dioxygenase-like lactoylglutathione lyase family enzyme
MGDFRDVDPSELRIPPSRRQGADPGKLARQISLFGRSAAGMPPAWVYQGPDGVLVLYNGVTRATCIAKLAPGSPIRVEVIGKLPKARPEHAGSNSIMGQKIAHVAIVVRDYDDAIAYYTNALGFDLVEDTPLGGGKRWVLVRPQGSDGTCLLLAQAASQEQESRVGNQTGGRVFLFLHTDDFWSDYNAMKTRGVQFIEEPREEAYGTVVVFVDHCGNKWDLVERKIRGS